MENADSQYFIGILLRPRRVSVDIKEELSDIRRIKAGLIPILRTLADHGFIASVL
jgi:hypothetical protein